MLRLVGDPSGVRVSLQVLLHVYSCNSRHSLSPFDILKLVLPLELVLPLGLGKLHIWLVMCERVTCYV